MSEPLRFVFTLACSVEHAFGTWTSRTSLWWPPSHTTTGGRGFAVHFEPFVGGRIFERTPEGLEIDWGELTAWEPPHHLAYLWHINTTRSRATDVAIRFVAQADGATRVEIVHSGWERLGASGAGWRDANRGGWSGLLPHFIAACEGAS